MSNIWHIYHTKLKKHQISDMLNPIIFTTCEQYRCKFLSQTSRLSILFFFHSFFFSISLFFSQTSPLVFSSHRFLFSLRSLSLWFYLFFFFVVILYLVRQWVGWDGDWRITGGGLWWSDSVVGESAGDGRIGGGGFCCAKSVNGFQIGELLVQNWWMGSESVKSVMRNR